MRLAVLLLVVAAGVLIILFKDRIFNTGLFSREEVMKERELNNESSYNILFLHHSTGRMVWEGGVREWFENYNKENSTDYGIVEQSFPKSKPYGWNNYPFDYWNIWVKHSGEKPYKREPTLEMLTKEYDMIIWKHCFPVGMTSENTGSPDIESDIKRTENYMVQYEALKKKMHEFSETNFLVWTPSVLVKSKMDDRQAERLRDFRNWMVDEWDEKGDNIFIWDFYSIETQGGLYLKPEYARGETDSHPNQEFSKMAAPLFCSRIVDVIEGQGDEGVLTGNLSK